MNDTEYQRVTDSPTLIPEIRWVNIDPRSGVLYYKGFVGHWGLFRIRPILGDTLGFHVSTLLPGMKGIVTSADSLEQAQQTAMRMLEHWMGMLYRDNGKDKSTPAAEARHSEADAPAALQLVHRPRVV